MVRSRVLGFLAITLCIVACLCAHAIVSKADARKAVKDAGKSTKQALKNAQGKVSRANNAQVKLKSYKEVANRAASEAEKTAKGNQDAEAIAKNARKASEDVNKLYPKALAAAEKFLTRVNALLSDAKKLDGKSDIRVLPDEDSSEDYTKAQESAVAVKAEAEALEKEITAALKLLADVHSAEGDMPELAKNAQLAGYHVDAIVALAKIETKLKDADTDIQHTQQKRDEANFTVKEVQELYKKAPENLTIYINALYTQSEADLSIASKAVDEAKNGKEDMLKEKEYADVTLAKIKNATDLDEARNELHKINGCVREVDKKVKDIKNALTEAETASINAKYRKESALSALSHGTTKPANEDDKNSENPDLTFNDSTEPPQKDATNKPTITASDQPEQDETTHPGNGKEVPKQGPGRDTAMTVSVSLLLALSVCAALH